MMGIFLIITLHIVSTPNVINVIYVYYATLLAKHVLCRDISYFFKIFMNGGLLSIAEISLYCIIKKYHTQWHNLKLNRVLTRGQHISRH